MIENYNIQYYRKLRVIGITNFAITAIITININCENVVGSNPKITILYPAFLLHICENLYI